MKNRRKFIKSALLTSAAIVSGSLLAKDEKASEKASEKAPEKALEKTPEKTADNVTKKVAKTAVNTSFPLGIIYSEAHPGKWKKKVSGHSPSIQQDGNKITIKTDHGMSEKHYIVRHTLVTESGEVLGEKTFTPSDKPISSFEIKATKYNKLYATSFCNKHDLWVNRIVLS